MSRTNYRPSGMLSWLLSHTNVRKWSFFGCIGTEERSLASWETMSKSSSIERSVLLRIKDRPSRHSALSNTRLNQRQTEYVASGGSTGDIYDHDLFCTHNEIVERIDAYIDQINGSLVLDITSLPKRFFFPIIRRILGAKKCPENFIVTYSIPEKYPSEELAENFNDWAHLPLFTGEHSTEKVKMLVVGVGFQALGLHDHLKGEPSLPIKLLVPFPAPPPAFVRSWDLLRKLKEKGEEDMFEIYRANSRDPSDTFDRLQSLSQNNKLKISLAPFGPKPMSLAMCLFACRVNCEALYTQPSVYNPDYSIGVSKINGNPEVYGYCLRLGGRDYYQL